MKHTDSDKNRVNDEVLNSDINDNDVSLNSPNSTEERLEKLENQTKQMSEKLENIDSDIQANKREVQYAINKIYSIRDANGLSDGFASDEGNQ